MHRTDVATATEDHLFTDGNPSAGVSATLVDASWLNAVQESLIAPILAAGLALIKGDNTQLLQAIQALIAAAVALRAPLASPALTGTPTAPTPGPGDNSTKLATTAWVQTLLGAFGPFGVSGIKLPGGLIIQWMEVTATAYTTVPHDPQIGTFPTAFPTAVHAVFGQTMGGWAAGGWACGAGKRDLATYQYGVYRAAGATDVTMLVIAIGE